jgi:hypothetical protein
MVIVYEPAGKLQFIDASLANEREARKLDSPTGKRNAPMFPGVVTDASDASPDSSRSTREDQT